MAARRSPTISREYTGAMRTPGYVHTLRSYLADNCNISRTAERLYIHRHTLMKRLDKIQELCGIDFNDYYARIYMSLALLFHDYFAF